MHAVAARMHRHVGTVDLLRPRPTPQPDLGSCEVSAAALRVRQVKRRAYYFEGKNGEELVERDVPAELEEQVRPATVFSSADAVQMPCRCRADAVCACAARGSSAAPCRRGMAGGCEAAAAPYYGLPLTMAYLLLWLTSYYGVPLTMAYLLLWLTSYYGLPLTMAYLLLWLTSYHGRWLRSGRCCSRSWPTWTRRWQSST
eukprot:scaffold29862_cov51-Phaeocystis_antarctica.AAC.4